MLVETQYFVVMSKLFTKQQNVKPVQIQSISEDKLKLIKTAKTVLDKIEILWEKKKMLVTSIFFFSLNVSKRLKSGLCSKDLNFI